MGRPLRVQNERFFYFLTNRCFQERYLLAPSKEVNALVEKCLTEALEHNAGVELYGGTVMSNHFHLIARAPKLNLSAFMQEFQSKLAKGINKIRGRRGSVFPKRFTSDIILDSKSLLQSLRYVLMNPVKALLVKHPLDWPGFITCNAFIDVKAANVLGKVKKDCSEFEVSALPQYASMAKQRRLLEPAVDGVAAHLVRGKNVVGADRVKLQRWDGRPKNPKRDRRAFLKTIFCACNVKRDVVVDAIRNGIESYRRACKSLDVSIKTLVPSFPVGFCLPTLAECWSG